MNSHKKILAIFVAIIFIAIAFSTMSFAPRNTASAHQNPVSTTHPVTNSKLAKLQTEFKAKGIPLKDASMKVYVDWSYVGGAL